jgi:hypothetical protein
MAKLKLLAQFLGAIVVASSSPAGATEAASASCMPLASVGEALCPPNWTGALAAKAAWCGKPLADVDISAEPCRGFLRYHHHYFDGGHHYCLYDPSTLALRGYYGFDRKAMNYGATSCGMSKKDFEDKECPRAHCR